MKVVRKSSVIRSSRTQSDRQAINRYTGLGNEIGKRHHKRFYWSTITLRGAVEYSFDESKFDAGEYAVEYLKRLSQTWRIYLGVEGTQDEVEFITEVQLFFTDNIYLKLNNGIGITSKATDWAPEIGVMFSFPGLFN